MNVLQDAERAAETAVPALRGARWSLYAIAVLLALCGLAFALWWLLVRPITDHQQAAQAKVDATLGAATGSIATAAIPQINEATKRKVEIDVAVRKGTIDVMQAADASVSARGVSDATLRAVCMLDDATGAERAKQPVRADPACERFVGGNAGGGQGPD